MTENSFLIWFSFRLTGLMLFLSHARLATFSSPEENIQSRGVLE
jgi:hypothetical protein